MSLYNGGNQMTEYKKYPSFFKYILNGMKVIITILINVCMSAIDGVRNLKVNRNYIAIANGSWVIFFLVINLVGAFCFGTYVFAITYFGGFLCYPIFRLYGSYLENKAKHNEYYKLHPPTSNDEDDS